MHFRKEKDKQKTSEELPGSHMFLWWDFFHFHISVQAVQPGHKACTSKRTMSALVRKRLRAVACKQRGQ